MLSNGETMIKKITSITIICLAMSLSCIYGAASSSSSAVDQSDTPMQVIQIPEQLIIKNKTHLQIGIAGIYGTSSDAFRKLGSKKNRRVQTIRMTEKGPVLLAGIAIFYPPAKGNYTIDTNLNFLQHNKEIIVRSHPDGSQATFQVTKQTNVTSEMPQECLLIQPMRALSNGPS